MRNIFLFSIMLGFVSCASKFDVMSYPSGAKVTVQNVVSKEKFEVGSTPVKFPHDESYGDGFVLIVEKPNFESKEIYLTKQSMAQQKYKVALIPKKKLSDEEQAAADDDKKDDKKDDPKEKEKDLEKRLAVLERTFEIYKDALFSYRYGAGFANFDRDRVDSSVNLVHKAQQFIEQKNLVKATEVIDQILAQDEYLSQGHILKGTLHYLKAEYPEAIRSWERALELEPSSKLTRRYLMNAYKKAGRAIPESLNNIEEVDRIPAASPLRADPLKLRGK